VRRTQWLNSGGGGGDGGVSFNGQRVLVVDEVDDTRRTLAYAVQQLRADIDAERRAHAAASASSSPSLPWVEPRLGVYVLHNKAKAKSAELPPGVDYFAGATVGGEAWLMYPWDADDMDDFRAEAAAEQARAGSAAAACCGKQQQQQRYGAAEPALIAAAANDAGSGVASPRTPM
jgi:hypoxanthine phosphoribosyltransferase